MAYRFDVDVPTLCHDDRLKPAGACRMCLVEVEGQRRLQPSCAWQAADGAVVATASPRVKKSREMWLSMYLADHPVDADGLPAERGVGNQLRQQVLCGGCIAVCPTGAMTEEPSLGIPPSPEPVRSTCTFCGVGCQVALHVTHGQLSRVTSPPPGTTVNDGNLCVKGRFAMEFVHHEDRLTRPLVRVDGELRPTSWDHALSVVAAGLLGVKERHGADALGFISSSRCTGEENYLMQKLSRAAFGTNNCHQCAAT